MINLFIKFSLSKYNPWENSFSKSEVLSEIARSVDQPTDRDKRTAAKQYAHPFLKEAKKK